MPVPQALVNTRWAASFSRTLRHEITVLTPTETQDATGAVVKAWDTPLAQCTALPCLFSMPTRGIRGRSGKVRTPDMIETVVRREVFIPRYIPEIDESMRAEVAGTQWEIEFIETDSQMNVTLLEVRQVA